VQGKGKKLSTTDVLVLDFKATQHLKAQFFGSKPPIRWSSNFHMTTSEECKLLIMAIFSLKKRYEEYTETPAGGSR